MPIIGAHVLLYSSEADALRAMLRDGFGFDSVDAGGGWLIFKLPPAELGVHPSEGPRNGQGAGQSITFMCEDIGKTVQELREKGVQIEGEPKEEEWGVTIVMTLPGDVEVTLYEPRHLTAIERLPALRS